MKTAMDTTEIARALDDLVCDPTVLRGDDAALRTLTLAAQRLRQFDDTIDRLARELHGCSAESDKLRAALAALEDGRHKDLPAAFAAVRQAALREAAGVLRRLMDDAGGLYVRAAYSDGMLAILELIDAAPAAEGGE